MTLPNIPPRPTFPEHAPEDHTETQSLRLAMDIDVEYKANGHFTVSITEKTLTLVSAPGQAPLYEEADLPAMNGDTTDHCTVKVEGLTTTYSGTNGPARRLVQSAHTRGSLRGRGLGTVAMQVALKILRERNENVVLEVASNDIPAAKRFYKRLGFVDIGNDYMTYDHP